MSDRTFSRIVGLAAVVGLVMSAFMLAGCASSSRWQRTEMGILVDGALDLERVDREWFWAASKYGINAERHAGSIRVVVRDCGVCSTGRECWCEGVQCFEGGTKGRMVWVCPAALALRHEFEHVAEVIL